MLHTNSGSIRELSLKQENPINLVDTFRRIEEAYHIEAIKNTHNKCASKKEEHVSIHEIVKTLEKETEEFLVFDINEKNLFVDHFIEKPVKAHDFALLKYNEVGTFYNKNYKLVKCEKNADNVEVIFECEGLVKEEKVLLRKKYKIENGNKINLKTEIENISQNEISFTYALENNITLLAGNEKDRYYFEGENKNVASSTLSEFGQYEGNIVGMSDSSFTKIDISVKSKLECLFLYMPNFTISDAVSKLEMNYQNSTIVSMIETTLGKNEKVEYSFEIYVDLRI